MDITLSSVIAVAVSLAYGVVLAATWRYRDNAKPFHYWLWSMLGLAAITTILGIFPADTTTRVMIYSASLMLVFYGAITFGYSQQSKWITAWLIVAGAWWVIVLLGSFTSDTLSQVNWLNETADTSDPAGLVTLGGWAVIGLVLFLNTFNNFYNARLPEIANRALYWSVMMPMVLLGAFFSASGVEVLRETGWVILLAGVAGAMYGVMALRVVDVRETLRITIVNMTLILVTSLGILAALVIVDEIDPDSGLNRWVLMVGLALATATIHAPIYWLVSIFTNRLVRGSIDNVAFEISRFAQAITGVVEMKELHDVATKTLQEIMGVRRSALIFATTGEDNTLNLDLYQNTGATKGQLVIGGPIYEQLFTKRKPLRQYDLEVSSDYSGVQPMEREFFNRLQMAAFAPIVIQNKLIGVLGCGSKVNDAPFSDNDLELLSTIANQTGIALRNARLVEDLRKREHDVAESNKRLEAAKRQLEALDAVKTDFITIASHELRTPLAQIRGHTDIIDALNDQSMINQDQLRGLTNNLRKAADRLESLIGDMLDVSQLDLSAMDLRFVQTSIENVVRMAIEPLQESIRNRKQSLTARGLRGLPSLEADMQRLVQAIRNVVLNAVKFTPDGGRIEIIGALLNNERTGQDEIQLVIRDTGIGIDPKNHEAIFEKFFRVGDPGLHSTGTTKFMGAGPGLGLTIARGVVTGHGGRIWAESEGFDPDNLPGSIFYIVLPLKPPEGQRRVMSFSTPIGARPTQAKRPEKATPPAAMEKTPLPTPAPAAPPPAPSLEDDEEAEDAPFVENNPTIFNPSASRAGVAAAAMAAAQEAAENLDAVEAQGDEAAEEPPDIRTTQEASLPPDDPET
ncbi:MAG: GAF domain-containing protein [Anaerolineales bacterium]|nr:GAF domain-containing protein [Anaerolineales bacterium]